MAGIRDLSRPAMPELVNAEVNEGEPEWFALSLGALRLMKSWT
jgi:hypothetical protein